MLKSTVKWCEDNLVLDGEPFSREAWPAMCEILDEMDRRRGCVFLLGGSIQSWKSFAAVLRCNANYHLRAARTGWYAPTVDLLKRFASSKFNSLYSDCELHRRIEPADRNKIQTYEKTFPHMPFAMLSAHTETHRQSLTLQEIVCDEAWMYEHGELPEIQGRLTAAVKTGNWRMIIPTSCWDVDSDVDQLWKQSNKILGHVKCPMCQEYFFPDPYRPEPEERIDEKTGKSTLYYPPGGIHYVSDDSVRDENGLIHKTKFNATVTYQCPKCSEHMDSVPYETLKFIETNPDAAPDVVAWLWTALCHMPLRPIAYQKVIAEEALAKGDSKPLEEFDRKRAMRPWSPMRLYKEVSLDKNMGNYGWEEPWEDEYVRFMKIDVQQGFYWWSVHLVSRETHCRLFACGQAWNDSELRELQLKYKVHDHGGDIQIHPDTGAYWLPRGCGVVIDGNYDTARVRRLAATYHWIVLRGDPDAKERRYKHKDGKYRIWNEIAAIEAFTGVSADTEYAKNADKYVAEIQYSPAAARGILRTLKSVTDPKPIYSYPKDVTEHCPAYLEHQKAWQYRFKKKNKESEQRIGEWVQVKEHDDLEWCERGNVVLLSTVGLIGADAVTDPNSKEENEESTGK